MEEPSNYDLAKVLRPLKKKNAATIELYTFKNGDVVAKSCQFFVDFYIQIFEKFPMKLRRLDSEKNSWVLNQK